MRDGFQKVCDLCLERFADVSPLNHMIDFSIGPDRELVTERFNGFKPDHHNIVTHMGEVCMTVVDLPVRLSYRIGKIIGFSDSIDQTRGVAYLIPANGILPCHKDEEAHDGYKRGQELVSINVSSPKSILYVNDTGNEGDIKFGVTDFFRTLLIPTKIYHGIIAGPEDLVIIQFPLKESVPS
jgi:hypothetical protein